MYQSICIVLVLSVIVLVYFDWTSQRDAEMARTYRCVIETAKAQHYLGDPSSPEAYALFAPTCTPKDDGYYPI